jgi:hypothetical protein
LHVDDAGDADTSAKKLSGLRILAGQTLNCIAHFVDHMVTAESDFGPESNFLEKLALAAHGGNAEVGTAEIDSDGEIRHGGEDYQNCGGACSLLIDDC